MKTTIDLPKAIREAAGKLAAELGVPRSVFYASAISASLRGTASGLSPNG